MLHNCVKCFSWVTLISKLFSGSYSSFFVYLKLFFHFHSIFEPVKMVNSKLFFPVGTWKYNFYSDYYLEVPQLNKKSMNEQEWTFTYHALHKKCPCLELFWSAFSCIRTEYGEIRSISLDSVWMQENADQNYSEYRLFHVVMTIYE